MSLLLPCRLTELFQTFGFWNPNNGILLESPFASDSCQLVLGLRFSFPSNFLSCQLLTFFYFLFFSFLFFFFFFKKTKGESSSNIKHLEPVRRLKLKGKSRGRNQDASLRDMSVLDVGGGCLPERYVRAGWPETSPNSWGFGSCIDRWRGRPIRRSQPDETWASLVHKHCQSLFFFPLLFIFPFFLSFLHFFRGLG